MKKEKKYTIVNFIILIISFMSINYILSKPSITLKGDKVVIININDNYEEKGFIGSYNFKDETSKIKITNNVDNKKIGKYKIIYSLNLDNVKVKNTRTVEVKDLKKPKIKLIGDGHACPNQKYKEEGYEAIDNYDGDLTSKVKIKYTKNQAMYTVLDKSKNKTIKKRKIIYKDIKGPNIALNGESLINVYVGEEYIEPGYIVSDNCDQNIDVSVDGYVDTNIIGKYIITYKATDTSGNTTELERIVNVIDYDQTPVIDGRGKTIYLTFDDGPSSSITPSLLQILKEENVKVTFFVVNHDDSLNYLIKQEYDDGHTVALHSSTHDYSYIYSSTTNFFNDLNSIREKVYNITGQYSNITRFPGGSSNTVSRRYSPGIMSTLTSQVLEQGYIYFDWNISCEDAGSAKDENDVYNNVVNNLVYENNIVLLHDFEGNYKTLNAIRRIIHYGKENGYTFKPITERTVPNRHRVNN